jgi:hypothetical protein
VYREGVVQLGRKEQARRVDGYAEVDLQAGIEADHAAAHDVILDAIIYRIEMSDRNQIRRDCNSATLMTGAK